MISPRVLRWSLILAAYNYDLEYRKGKDIANADALSRLPLNTPECEVPTPADVLLLEFSPVTQLNSKLISSATKKDTVLSRVALMVMNGWPSKVNDEQFKPYFCRRNELSVHQNCVLWGSRVVIPSILRKDVLTLLHNGHPGMVRMKGLSRSYVWWPLMDSEIEVTVKSCSLCQENQRAPAKAPIHPWEWTDRPWSRLHIDFAGPFQGKAFLIVVDSHSKWLEVSPVSSMTSSAAINFLRVLFATHGLPDSVVSDNAQAFKSSEFIEFLVKNQIRPVTSAPYHPSSNGQAERMVATTKQALKRIIQGNWTTRLARFLFSQHILPCTTTGKSPAEVLMNRRLVSLLDRLHPDLNKEMRSNNDRKMEEEGNKRLRIFKEDDPVYIRNYSNGTPWIPAKILENTGPISYKTESLIDGIISKRHVDQIRDRIPVANTSMDTTKMSTDVPLITDDSCENSSVAVPESTTSGDELIQPTVLVPNCERSEAANPPLSVLRRSQRNRNTPKHLKDFVLNS